MVLDLAVCCTCLCKGFLHGHLLSIIWFMSSGGPQGASSSYPEEIPKSGSLFCALITSTNEVM